MANTVKIVTQHSQNRSAHAIAPYVPAMVQPRNHHILMIWPLEYDETKVALSTAYEWHICEDDSGFITLKAYLLPPVQSSDIPGDEG